MPRPQTYRVIVAEVEHCLQSLVWLIPMKCDLWGERLEDGFVNADCTLNLG